MPTSLSSLISDHLSLSPLNVLEAAAPLLVHDAPDAVYDNAVADLVANLLGVRPDIANSLLDLATEFSVVPPVPPTAPAPATTS